MLDDASFQRLKRRYRERGEIDAELFALLRRLVFTLVFQRAFPPAYSPTGKWDEEAAEEASGRGRESEERGGQREAMPRAPAPGGSRLRGEAPRRALRGRLPDQRGRGDERLVERAARGAARQVPSQEQALELRELPVRAQGAPLPRAAAAAVAILPIASHPYFSDDSESRRLGIRSEERLLGTPGTSRVIARLRSRPRSSGTGGASPPWPQDRKHEHSLLLPTGLPSIRGSRPRACRRFSA